MSSSTLTSLAMLKVHIDQGQDYIDYLRPFILEVLTSHKPDPVTDKCVSDHIRGDFGLEIPPRVVQIVLKRLSRHLPIKKDDGVYRIVGELPGQQIVPKKAMAEQHIKAVITGLRKISETTPRPITSDEEAVTAICTFLTQFSIPCLRAFLRGSTIPTIEDRRNDHIVLVSKYVMNLQNDPESSKSFKVVIEGHMLANALLCPDLQNTPKSYKGTTFYLDTPLLVRRLDLVGNPHLENVKSLITLLRNLGARVAAFSHSREELEHVISGAASFIDSYKGRGGIIREARRKGTTKSDFLLLLTQVDEKLKNAEIEIIDTPPYIDEVQIDEAAFENFLDDEISYFNPRAKQYDINSVRSIYALRNNEAPRTIEKSRAILVTNNSGFAYAAYNYDQVHDQSKNVSTVITDFSLANMAWLKAPLGASSLPMEEVFAFSYAALHPSESLLDSFMNEIDKLEKSGKISARDHQLLRSSVLAQEELVNLTLGEEDALTEQTVTETLRRVTDEIKKEENDKYSKEKIAHLQTQQNLEEERAYKKELQQKIYWRCEKRANILAWGVSLLLALFILGGLVATGFGLHTQNPIVGWAFAGASIIVLILSCANLIWGATVRGLHKWLRTYFLKQCLRREEQAGLYHLPE